MKKNLQIREGKEKTVIFFMADAYSIRACKENGRAKRRRKAMTYLELIARVGTSPMDVVKMYFKGMITEKELSNVIGRNRAGIVEEYKNQTQTSVLEAACTGDKKK